MAKEGFISNPDPETFYIFVEILMIDLKCTVLLICEDQMQPNEYMHTDRETGRDNIPLPLFHPSCILACLVMITQNLTVSLCCILCFIIYPFCLCYILNFRFKNWSKIYKSSNVALCTPQSSSMLRYWNLNNP